MPEGIQILAIVLPVVTVTVFLVFLIVSFCTNSENRKYYKRTYNAIVSGEYVLVDDSTSHGTRMKYFVPPQYVNEYWRCRDQVILFYEKGKPDGVKLLCRGNRYIHNYGFPMIDFYAMYWFKKIVKAMNQQEYYIRPHPLFRQYNSNNFKFLR